MKDERLCMSVYAVAKCVTSKSTLPSGSGDGSMRESL